MLLKAQDHLLIIHAPLVSPFCSALCFGCYLGGRLFIYVEPDTVLYDARHVIYAFLPAVMGRGFFVDDSVNFVLFYEKKGLADRGSSSLPPATESVEYFSDNCTSINRKKLPDELLLIFLLVQCTY